MFDLQYLFVYKIVGICSTVEFALFTYISHLFHSLYGFGRHKFNLYFITFIIYIMYVIKKREF